MSGPRLIEYTSDREPLLERFMESERLAVEAAFGPEAWPAVREFIEGVPWESDADRVLADRASLTFRDGGPMTPDESARFVAANRTFHCMYHHEKLCTLARQMGISFTAAEQEYGHLLDDPAQGCALYRYWDGAGNLLYVGISDNPDQRDEQHSRNSEWFQFAASSDVSWFTSRDAAHEAERSTIKAERPIFNKAHNKVGRERAIGYLFAALGSAS